MTQYPWNVLGLTNGATVQEIRRAYAKRLKATRPEDDPEGFQILVEAKDRALHIAESAQERSEPDGQLALTAEPLEDHSSPTGNERDPDQEQLDSVSFGAAGAPLHLSHASDGSMPRQQVESSVVELELDRLRTSGSSQFDREGWAHLLSQIGGLPYEARAHIEPLIISAFADIFKGREDSALPPKALTKPADRVLVAQYDEEFGWSEDDSVIYKMIGRDAGDRFKWHLSQIWAEQFPEHELGRKGLALKAKELAARNRYKRPKALSWRGFWLYTIAVITVLRVMVAIGQYFSPGN